MALPPERISIKRRRQDEPVDTLILEPGSVQDKKRRYTNFYFQRLRHDHFSGPAPAPQRHQATSTTQPAVTAARDYQALGIPMVRSTAPGDEVKDFERYKAAQNEKAKESNEASDPSMETRDSLLLRSSGSSSSLRHQVTSARRFHLTPDLSSPLRPSPGAGMRRMKHALRPPLATFIEQRVTLKDGNSIHRKPPVDSIVQLNEKAASASVESAMLSEYSIERRTQTSTFQKPFSPTTRRGQSIRDDPATWDYGSDQLANELAALAFDIDPGDATEPPQVVPAVAPDPRSDSPVSRQHNDVMVVDDDNDFVFETYVRIKYDAGVQSLTSVHNKEIGVLVIDDENEGLWERYVQSDDDDDEWDEEDEDSNAEDNPRNEYPDDEVSSDDEYGRNLYKYRRNASDDEEYDNSQES